MEAMGIFVEAYLRIGEALGPPPGRGVGGRNKESRRRDSLSKDQIAKARAARWKIQREHRTRYWAWLWKSERGQRIGESLEEEGLIGDDGKLLIADPRSKKALEGEIAYERQIQWKPTVRAYDEITISSHLIRVGRMV